jgi:hypothetical protein
MKRTKNQVLLAWFITAIVASGSFAKAGSEDNISPSPSRKLSTQSDQVMVQRDSDNSDLIIYNRTSNDIFIPFPAKDNNVGERTFRFYQETPLGWRRLYPLPIPDLYAGWIPGGPPGLVISPGRKEEIAISEFLIAYTYTRTLTDTNMVQVRYKRNPTDNNDNLVLYSDDSDVAAPISQTQVSVTSTQPQSLIFNLQNASSVPIRFIDICPNWGVKSGAEDGYLSMQRQTIEGGWEIIHGKCKLKTDPSQVDPGKTIQIDGAPWFKEELDGLPDGIYRWDVAFYLAVNRDGSRPYLDDVRHVFGKPFKYPQQ